jgi:nucleotide-binding universal stress UspA family protein
MLRSILVPLDGSTFGEHALPLAAGLARRAGATLHLVHVHQILPPTTISGVAVLDALDLHLRQDEQAYLADVARRLTDVCPVPVKTILVDGDVEPAIRNHADRIDADLVVMATHGRGAMGRFWLGSVADDLLRDLPRPILVVRPHDEGKADFHRDPDLSTIVLPFDGSELAEQIIEPTVRLGELYDATYILVRVIEPALRTSYLPDGASVHSLSHSVLTEIQQMQKRLHDEAQTYLNQLANKLRERNLKVQTRVVIDEQPAVGLLVEAQARGAGLIAIETHARRGLSRMFMGSVADKLVRGGVVPVLLNRPVKR